MITNVIRRCLTAAYLLAVGTGLAWPVANAQVPPKAPQAAKPVVYESPAACFEAFLKAGQDSDPAAVMPLVTESYQNYLVGNTAFHVERQCFFKTSNAKACEELLKKHDLYGKDLMGYLQIVDSPSGPGAVVGFIVISHGVKDKAEFLREVRKTLQPDKKEQEADEKSDKKKPPTPKLEDVEVSGDDAKATISVPGNDEKSLIFFRKVDGSWRLSLAEKEPEWRKFVEKKDRSKNRD